MNSNEVFDLRLPILIHTQLVHGPMVDLVIAYMTINI